MNPYVGKTFLGFFKTLFSRSGPLAFDEIQLLTFLCIGIASALCGTFLMLRRASMLANALSHTALLGLAVAFWLFGYAAILDMKILLIAALLSGLLTTALLAFLEGHLRMQREGAVALVFTALFSLGVVLTSLMSKNLHIGIEAVSGNGDLLQLGDLKVAALLAASTLSMLALFLRPLALSSFDGTYAASLGVRTKLLHLALMCQSSACVIGGFRCVGLVMVLAFFIAPALFARLFAKSLGRALVYSGLYVVLCTALGCALSRHLLTSYQLPLSTGALIATLLCAGTAFCFVVKIPRKMLS